MNKNPTAIMAAYIDASNALADILEDIVTSPKEDLAFYQGIATLRLADYKAARADWETLC